MEKRTFKQWISYVFRRPGRIIRLFRNSPRGYFFSAMRAGDWKY